MGGGKEGPEEELTEEEEESSSDSSEEDTAAADLEAKAKRWEAWLLRRGWGPGEACWKEGTFLPLRGVQLLGVLNRARDENKGSHKDWVPGVLERAGWRLRRPEVGTERGRGEPGGLRGPPGGWAKEVGGETLGA